MFDATTLQVIAILFLGTVIRSSLGFGEALVSVPLLAFLIPVRQAAPIAVLVSVTIALLILIRDWRSVHLRGAGWLIVSTLFGIPLGLWGLQSLPESVVKAVLAVVILTFSLYSLRARTRFVLKDERLAWLFGFQAGVLGGAYGMNGPPLVVYGSLRGWPPAQFRATLQAYFFVASLVGMGGYWASGLWTESVNHFYLASLPAVALAVVIGRAIHIRMHPEAFTSYVYIGLAAVGLLLLAQAARTLLAS